MEHASSWRIQRAGHLSREEYPLSLRVYDRVGYGDGGKERLGIGVQRVRIDLVPLSDLYNMPYIGVLTPNGKNCTLSTIIG
jgi:hypothetical protein